MVEQTNNKTIAKNTVLLYFRMMITMVVSLYTARVILDVLGVDDFGIYQTVGGVVAMLSFVSGALATGSSRFFTYELGTGNFDKLKRTFSSVLTVHILLVIIVALVAETVGIWFVYNKLVIPPNRINAAVMAYHFSILATAISIIQIPYNSCIISHEKMNIYAYMSIIEVTLKLAICYLLAIESIDKLVLYAILLFVVQSCLAIIYIVICTRNFEETRYKPLLDKEILKGVLGYSGWNLFSNSAIALITQGTTIIINMFFSPAIVAARTIANQVNMAAFQFISNFRTAANPQIVKKYASGDFEGSKYLLLNSTKFSYYLMLMLALPVCLVAEDLLGIWLKNVPEYTTIFLQLAVITSLFQVFDNSFYTALYAKGQIRENALITSTVLFLLFPIVYFMFKNGFSPVVVAWGLLIDYALIGLIIKPIMLIKIVHYNWNDIFSVFIPCLKVTLMSCPIPVLCYYYNDIIFSNIWIKFFGLCIISLVSVAVSIWLVGLDKNVKLRIINIVKVKIFIGSNH